ncbi:MAG: hypothetical protein A2X47_08245 [Lentisphaerae bacterium GWF2_38_69]|nr:MAG: hypothetical protein A2X47_08245 [Lentisphaerae bacterium GWF2_38_69]
MIHSGSRHLGQKVAKYYWRQAVKFSEKENIQLPNADLAFLPADLEEGLNYIRDMNFALEYAQENRKRMMAVFKDKISELLNGKVIFLQEVNIHHNYAALENHFGKDLWVHRKGATSAKDGEIGIIPGSMGTPSYIVKGKGNLDSFQSCSHGAGRAMSRSKASKNLTVEECNKDMEGIVFDRWNKNKKCYRKDAEYDLSEAPQAYKNIESVIESELDLIDPIVKLWPLAVLKG